jgi:putative ABC transport system ATP-binding protein
VAVARALANAPRVVFADEPTGNLDSRTSHNLLELFASLANEGQTIVMVTHDQSALRYASRAITLVDGRVTTDEVPAYV